MPNSADEQTRMTAAFHQLLASAKAVKIAHEIDPENKVGMMYAGLFSYPNSCDPEDIQANADFMNFSLFYCDVQVRGYYPAYKMKEFERLNIKLPEQPGDMDTLKAGTVDFIAFSYYFTMAVGKNSHINLTLGSLDTGYTNPYLSQTDWGWTI